MHFFSRPNAKFTELKLTSPILGWTKLFMRGRGAMGDGMGDGMGDIICCWSGGTWGFGGEHVTLLYIGPPVCCWGALVKDDGEWRFWNVVAASLSGEFCWGKYPPLHSGPPRNGNWNKKYHWWKFTGHLSRVMGLFLEKMSSPLFLVENIVCPLLSRNKLIFEKSLSPP